MNRLLAAAAISLGIGGCAAQLVHPTTAFNTAEAEQAMRRGHAIIEGSALVRQRGGGVVTCAGGEVSAIPDTAFSRERMYVLYGSIIKGFRENSQAWGQRLPAEAPAQYRALQHASVCDAQGNFQFTNVAAGTYYVVTSVSWNVPGRYGAEGGALMERVTVTETDIKRIVLSP